MNKKTDHKTNNQKTQSRLPSSFIVGLCIILAGAAVYYKYHQSSSKNHNNSPLGEKKSNDQKNTNASKAPLHSDVAANVAGENIYKKDIWKVVNALSQKQNRTLTEEGKEKLYNMLLKSEISTTQQEKAIMAVAKEYGIEETEDFKKQLSEIKSNLQKQMEQNIQKRRQDMATAGLLKKVRNDVLTSEKEKIENQTNAAKKKEKNVSFAVFPSTDKKQADRIKKALDAEDIEKRQAALESIAVSQGKEKPIVHIEPSFKLSKSVQGKKILNMRPGESQVVEEDGSVEIVLCLKKESLSHQEAKNYTIGQIVIEKVSSLIAKAKKGISVQIHA